MCSLFLTAAASIECEVDDDGKRNSSTECGIQLHRPVRCGKRVGIGSRHDRGDACVGLFRKLGEGSLQPRGLRRADQLLHQVEPLACRVEGGDGFGGEPRRDGGSDAGAHRDWTRDPAGYRAADAAGGAGGVSVSGQSLGIRVGHGLDLGIAGAGACIACAGGGTGRASVGS